MVKDVFTHKFSSPRSNCVMRCFKYVNRKLFKDLEVMQFNYFLKLFQLLHDLYIYIYMCVCVCVCVCVQHCGKSFNITLYKDVLIVILNVEGWNVLARELQYLRNTPNIIIYCDRRFSFNFFHLYHYKSRDDFSFYIR